MIGLAVGFGLSGLLLTRYWPVGVIAAVAGGALPYLYVRRCRKKRNDASSSHSWTTVTAVSSSRAA